MESLEDIVKVTAQCLLSHFGIVREIQAWNPTDRAQFHSLCVLNSPDVQTHIKPVRERLWKRGRKGWKCAFILNMEMVTAH